MKGGRVSPVLHRKWGVNHFVLFAVPTIRIFLSFKGIVQLQYHARFPIVPFS